ncbi:MAG: phosphatidylglycerol lysyltransferase domain-containing protein [Paracoccaceae bacterium]
MSVDIGPGIPTAGRLRLHPRPPRATPCPARPRTAAQQRPALCPRGRAPLARSGRGPGRGAGRALALLARQLLPLLIGGLCLWLLAQRLHGFDLAALGAALQRIEPARWGLAALATAISFQAVGRYDLVIHRHLGTACAAPAAAAQATRAGMLSIALAQTLGLGVITGALARWRALPGLSLADCTRISALVAVSFLTGWAVITALAGLILPAPLALGPLWLLPPVLALGLAVLSLLRVRLRLPGGRRLSLPSLPAMATILWLTFLDTAAAALALYLLLPAGLALDFATLYPAFLLALGAALVSGTPGGVGPFELTLLALLPQLPEPELIAGVLGFRLIYYALPAVLAALLLALPQRPVRHPSRAAALPRPGLRDLAHARRAELGVARQNDGRLLHAPGDEAAGIAVETGQTVTLLFDPASGDIAPLLQPLTDRARTRNRLPLLYKCSARSAAGARRSGFRLWHVADEAVIDPARFDLDTPARRQLRRKLRQAEKAGLRITRPDPLPLAAMARVDAEWRARQGGARGLTMGRFDAAYLSHHQVFLAWSGGALQGFVSFHVTAHELCLDLMRSADDAPPGTMHALVAQAIAQAAACGRRRLSLASIPARGRAPGPLERRLRAAVFTAAGGAGLAQFKLSFAPRLEPLYLAAPTRTGLILGAADLAFSVRRDGASNPAHDHREEFGIAPAAPI